MKQTLNDRQRPPLPAVENGRMQRSALPRLIVRSAPLSRPARAPDLGFAFWMGKKGGGRVEGTIQLIAARSVADPTLIG